MCFDEYEVYKCFMNNLKDKISSKCPLYTECKGHRNE